MKIIHKYEDGTLKVFYHNGHIGLLPPVQIVDAKILVTKGDSTYSTIVAGFPAEIQSQEDAHWARLSGTHYSEILFKIIVNAGMVCAKALGPEAFQHFGKCLPAIREILCKKENDSLVE